MSKRQTIKLSSPMLGHGGPIQEIVLREPLARDTFAIGDLSVASRTADGDIIFIPREDAYERYLQVCLVDENPDIVLAGLSLADGMRVREAIDRFFGEARLVAFPPAPATLPGSPTTPSS